MKRIELVLCQKDNGISIVEENVFYIVVACQRMNDFMEQQAVAYVGTIVRKRQGMADIATLFDAEQGKPLENGRKACVGSRSMYGVTTADRPKSR